MVAAPDSDQRQPEQNLNSLKIVTTNVGSNECSEVAECFIDTFATDVQTPLATNEARMTSVRLEGVCVAKFECDTAASQSVISEKVLSFSINSRRSFVSNKLMCQLDWQMAYQATSLVVWCKSQLRKLTQVP